MSKRTLKTIQRDFGVVVCVKHDSEWQEFQCVVPGQPAATYHTSDKTDAFATAEAMAAQLVTQARGKLLAELDEFCEAVYSENGESGDFADARAYWKSLPPAQLVLEHQSWAVRAANVQPKGV